MPDTTSTDRTTSPSSSSTIDISAPTIPLPTPPLPTISQTQETTMNQTKQHNTNSNSNHNNNDTSPSTSNNHTNNVLIEVVATCIQLTVISFASYYMSKWVAGTIRDASGDGMNKGNDKVSRNRLEKLLLDRAKRMMEEEQEQNADCEENGSGSLEEIDENGDAQTNTRSKEDVMQSTIEKIKSLTLSPYECQIASEVIDPSEITTEFRHVGGIDHIKKELWELVVLPIVRPDLFCSTSGLVSPPKGILLYGAPGTGKTMLAKAIAKESGATFVNVRLSTILDKFLGESNKLINATFTLAQKLAPSVIFIDEIDTFLNQRDSGDGVATSSIKSEFLTLWDGMMTDSKNDAPVIVLGATNRPYDVDSAILRRLPRTFEIGLPNRQSRLQILELFLEKQPLTAKAQKIIPQIAKVTEGYSGSDLKELCRAAAMEPIREISKELSKMAVMGNNGKFNGKKIGPKRGEKTRPLNERDFAAALKKVKKTGEAASSFRKEEQGASLSDSQAAMDFIEVLQGVMNNRSMRGSGNGSASGEGDDNMDDEKAGDDIPNL